MDNDNAIEIAYRELDDKSLLNFNHIHLYSSFEDEKLQKVMSSLHGSLTYLYKRMNLRLPTRGNVAYYWAHESRGLISIIDLITRLIENFEGTRFSFAMDEYYQDIIELSKGFLEKGGTTLPNIMETVTLYYAKPIFIKTDSASIKRKESIHYYDYKQIGSGSYATVFKYKDDYYNRHFVVKRARKDLNEKEIERFKREYQQMLSLSSPYITEVYRYCDTNNEYTMEYMDYTLDDFISKNNSNLCFSDRRKFVLQVLNAFDYIHSKEILHRDISPRNILLKKYETINIVKISDFGLVKIPDSYLTSFTTELKGYFNDPSLSTDGFDTYNLLHETYALTRLIFFIMTGKTNTSNIENTDLKRFVHRGINVDLSQRYKDIRELLNAFNEIKEE